MALEVGGGIATVSLRRFSVLFRGWGNDVFDLPFTGSKKSFAFFSPALAPWSPSGANLIVAPFEPPVPVSLSYLFPHISNLIPLDVPATQN